MTHEEDRREALRKVDEEQYDADQEPSSSKMRWLFLETVELSHITRATTLSPAARGMEWLRRHDVLKARTDALYRRMQAEEQERAQMRGLLERYVALFTYGGDSVQPMRASYEIDWQEVAQVQKEARALLATTGKDTSDGNG